MLKKSLLQFTFVLLFIFLGISGMFGQVKFNNSPAPRKTPTYFTNEFFDLNDNQTPSGWQLIVENPTIDIANGKMNAYIVDANGFLRKNAVASPVTDSITLEWDGQLQYAEWGMTSGVQINLEGEKYLYFANNFAMYSPNNNRSRVFIQHSTTPTNNQMLLDQFLPPVYGNYHYKLTISNAGFRYSAINSSTNQEYFNYFYTSDTLSNIFNLSKISGIGFEVHTTTDNNNWIDNLKVQVYERAQNNGLVAYYPFNGNANDESGNGNNGTVEGAALTTDRFGNANKAYNFDGINDRILTQANLFNGPFSFSTWIKTNQDSVFPYGVGPVLATSYYHGGYGNGLIIAHTNKNTTFSWYPANSGWAAWDTIGIINNNQWHQIAGSWDGTTGQGKVKLYIDGILASAATAATIVQNHDFNLRIGHSSDGPWNYYHKGVIDDIRIYNREISSAEIDSLYHEGGWQGNTSSGLVAYYPFNGNANDESGNGNNGTVEGAALTTDRFGNANKAYTFDGISADISVPHHAVLNFSSDIAVSAWIKTAPTQGELYIVSKGNETPYTLGLRSGKYWFKIGGGISGAFIESNSAIDSNWHFLVGTYDGSTAKFYIDGTLDKQTNFSGLLATDINPMYFGRRAVNPSVNFYHGKIDDIRIYNQSLSQTQIDSLYHEGGWQGNNNGGLVAYYPFSGNANNAMGNFNNGTVANAILTTDRFGNPNQAYYFNGSNAQITAGSNTLLENTENHSLSVWAKDSLGITNGSLATYANPNGENGYELVYDQNTGKMGMWALQGFSTGGWAAAFSDSSLRGDNKWHHYVGVRRNGTSYLYVDGELQQSSTNHAINFSNSSIRIGNSGYWQNNQFFGGKLDDISYYNRALTNTEIDSLYHEGGWQGNNGGGVTATNLSTYSSTWFNQIPAAQSRGNKLYYFGGQTSVSSVVIAKDKATVYDLQTNAWSELNITLPYGLTDYQVGAQYLDGHFYLPPAFANGNSGGFGTHRKIIDVNTSNSSAAETLPLSNGNPVWNVGSCKANGKIFYFGGHTGSDRTDIYEFNPAANTAVKVADMPIPATGVIATLANNGLIYLWGGNFAYAPYSNLIHTFNPVNFQVSTLPNVSFPFTDFNAIHRWYVPSENAIYFFKQGVLNPAVYKFNITANTITGTGIVLEGKFTSVPAVQDENNPGTVYVFKVNNDTYTEPLTLVKLQFGNGAVQQITVTSPAGGEAWTAGDIHEITWNTSSGPSVKLEYTTDNGSNWILIDSSYNAASGTYSWMVPNTPSAQCKVKIIDSHNTNIFDVSDSVFTIVQQVPVVANFSAAPTSGTAPLTVQFSDSSTGSITNWEWDFNNDGVVDATTQNPSYTYSQPGVYSVKLKVFNATQSDVMIKQNYVTTTYFTNEFFDLNDNQTPSGWQLIVENPTIDIANGKMNAYTVDANGFLRKNAVASPVTDSITLEWDGQLQYSYWGMTSGVQIYLEGAKYLNFVNNFAMQSPNINRSRVLIQHSITPTNNQTLLDQFLPPVYGNYHYKLTIANTGFRYSATNSTTNQEYFNYFYTSDTLSNIFSLSKISGLSFEVHTTTDNNNWIDNFKIQIHERAQNSGLVAYYPFNSNANDESGNGNNASQIYGGVSFVPGKIGSAANFGGVDNPGHIKIPNSPTLQFSNALSIVFWMKFNSYNGTYNSHAVIAKDHDVRGFRVQGYAPNNRFNTGFFNGPYYQSNFNIYSEYPSYQVGDWIQVAYVISDSTGRLYYNGTLDTSVVTNQIDFTQANGLDLYFGKYYDNWYPFNGALDEVRIYNRALTQNEILQLYGTTPPTILSLTSPNGGEAWTVGATDTIRWSSNNVANVKLEYTTDNGINWVNIAASLQAAAGRYAWTVPNTPSAACLVRISEVSNTQLYDCSDTVFSITNLCKDVSINAGWNIISIPLLSTDMGVGSMFPMATSSAFSFANGYQTVQTFETGKGYWLRFPQIQTIPVCGSLTDSIVSLSSGWNLIGPKAVPVNTSLITTLPPNIINSVFFGYNNGYINTQTLLPGNGYWVRASQAGTMSLPSAPLAKGQETAPAAVPSDWPAISMSDALNQYGTVYIIPAGKTVPALNTLTLPPAPPEGILDVRFATGRCAEQLAAEGQVIRIQGATYPVILSLKPATGQAEDFKIRLRDKATGGKLIDRIIGKNTTVSIENESVNIIEILPVEKPVSYELLQNFPNPFNPSTVIRFGLPEKTNVTLTVYNQLGEKITTLIDEQRDAGYHSVEWAAGNLSSGIYFYELRSEKFRSIKKLMLLK